jgi:hypothetical protein
MLNVDKPAKSIPVPYCVLPLNVTKLELDVELVLTVGEFANVIFP